jgi:hypothetical protein
VYDGQFLDHFEQVISVGHGSRAYRGPPGALSIRPGGVHSADWQGSGTAVFSGRVS